MDLFTIMGRSNGARFLTSCCKPHWSGSAMLSKFSDGLPKPNIDKYIEMPKFLETVWLGDIAKVKTILDDSQMRALFINTVDPVTGMNALHIAVGRDLLEITKLLVEAGIEFIPDNEGRMPSLIAAICDVSDDMADYIGDAEER